MKFDAHKGMEGGPATLYNANGEHIPYAVRGDTETGIVECYIFPYEVDYTVEPPRVKTFVAQYAAPMYLKPLSEVKVGEPSRG